jgi:hypothetical protein
VLDRLVESGSCQRCSCGRARCLKVLLGWGRSREGAPRRGGKLVSVARAGHNRKGWRNHHKICCRIFTRGGSRKHLQNIEQHRRMVGAGEQAAGVGGMGCRSRRSTRNRSIEQENQGWEHLVRLRRAPPPCCHFSPPPCMGRQIDAQDCPVGSLQ